MCSGGVGLLVLLVAAFLSTPAHAGGYDWQWRTGRATNYGGAGDPWSIHHGSCGYKYLDPTANKGWDVAALSDAVPDYKDSCGRCYEIACAPMHLKDGYGTGLDRSQVCFDTAKSVVVMITDSCPCNYPPNQYSNRRWCCGDYFHFDMSTWAFEKLAERKWGVIGIRYRPVPCDYCPDNPATVPNGGWPSQASEGAPGGWQPSWDKRPWGKMCFKSSLERQGGQSSGGSDKGGGSSNRRQAVQAFPSDSLLSGWQDLTSKMDPWSASAPDGQSAYCGTLQGYESLTFRGSTGSLMGKRQLLVDIKTDHGVIPDFSLSLSSSSKGTCRTLDLRSAQVNSRNSDWVQLSIPLASISWFSSWWKLDQSQMPFTGCSSSIGAWDVNQIDFKNKWAGQQSLCLSNVKAY